MIGALPDGTYQESLRMDGDGVSTGGTAREALGEGAPLPVEAVGWEHSVDEAPGRKRLRRQDGRCEHHLRCACCADP